MANPNQAQNTYSVLDKLLSKLEESGLWSTVSGGGSTVTWNQIQTDGEKIAEITIDGTKKDVMADTLTEEQETELLDRLDNIPLIDPEIGKILFATKGSLSTTANVDTHTRGAELILEKGTWLIAGHVSFGTISGSSAVNKQITIFKDGESGAKAFMRVMCANGNYSALETVYPVQITTPSTYYVALSTSIAGSGHSTSIRAVKIR